MRRLYHVVLLLLKHQKAPKGVVMVVSEEPRTATKVLESILECRDIHVSYNLRKGMVVKVFEGLSISVRYTEFLGIVGPSGCGKTTLLKVMAGLVKPSVGAVYYKGQPLNSPTPAIALVLQNFALFPWYTVLENVMLALSKDKELSKQDKLERCRAFLNMVGLSGFESAYPAELSDGMKRKVMLARALVTQPDVLLMDEPFSNVDPLTAISLRREIESMWLSESLPPSSVVLVSHDIEEVVELCDRVIVLTPRPAKIAATLDISLPRPRIRRSREFYEYVDEIFTLMS